jgi:hypothetical protein
MEDNNSLEIVLQTIDDLTNSIVLDPVTVEISVETVEFIFNISMVVLFWP